MIHCYEAPDRDSQTSAELQVKVGSVFLRCNMVLFEPCNLFFLNVEGVEMG